MSDNEVKTAVSAFQAARVGHDKKRRSEAALRLARTAAKYLNAGGKTTNREELLKGLAALVSGQDGK